MRDDKNLQSAKTKNIAHRGAWKKAALPQNSIASLIHAFEIGCDGSECDVWLTSDDIVVVNHDPDFYGVKIESSTYRQLLEKQHSNGENIPTLQEYCSAMSNYSEARLLIEIKPSQVSPRRSLESAKGVVEKVQETGLGNCVDYISFDSAVLHEIRALDASARVAYLGGDKSPNQLQDEGFWGADYHHWVLHAHPHWLKEFHSCGLTFNSWTVNSAQTMRWLLDESADFITTDDPELLLELRESLNH
jgi:glycerophosphoryl diester phosphodiesterase